MRQHLQRLSSFCRRGKRLYLLISFSAVTLASILRLADEAIPPPPDLPTIVETKEIFDNHDWEVQFTTSEGEIMTTNNDVDDRLPNARGSFGVWQRLNEHGWEVVSWKVGEGEKILTSDLVDDREPSTDGESVVWQRQTESGWKILYLDLGHVNGDPEEVSERGVNSMHPKVAQGRVTWQAWIDDNWEIMNWNRIDGRNRLTTNTEPDLQPDVSQQYVVWEGVDPQQGDRDIFAIDLSNNAELIMTDNQSNDSGAMVDDDGRVEWFAESSSDASGLANTDLGNEFHYQQAEGVLIEVAPPEEAAEGTSETPAESSTDTSAESPPENNAPTENPPASTESTETSPSTDTESSDAGSSSDSGSSGESSSESSESSGAASDASHGGSDGGGESGGSTGGENTGGTE